MSDTLYLQLDQNIEVTNPHVYLQDIAALSMADANGPGSHETWPICNVRLGSSENDPESGTFH